MAYYDGRIDELERDFYTTRVNSPKVKYDLELLLSSLHIPKSQWYRYFRPGKTVYDFLAKLTREDHIQVAYFLEIIEEKKSISLIDKLLGGLLAAAVVAGLLSTPALSWLLDLLKAFCAVPMSLPIFSMVLSGITVLYNTYNNHYDKKKSRLNRIRDHLFLFANTVLTFVSYGYWLVAAPAMPILGAWLFLAAAFVDAGRELFYLAQEYIKYKLMPPNYDSDTKNVNRMAARYEVGFQRHRNAALINLVFGLMLVGLIALWSFVPMGLGLNLLMITIAITIFCLKYYLSQKNETLMRERLQGRLKEIEEAPDFELNPENELVDGYYVTLGDEPLYGIAPPSQERPIAHDSRAKRGLTFFSTEEEDDEEIDYDDESLYSPHLLANPTSTSNRSMTRPML
jgi:hypothetical protein